jgi:hypothetical protein
VLPIASIELQRRWSHHRQQHDQAAPAAPTLRALPAPAP